MPKLLKENTLEKTLKKGQAVKPLIANEVAMKIDHLRARLYSIVADLAELSGELYSRNVKDDIPF